MRRLVVVLLLCACSAKERPYVQARGAMGDGTPFDVNVTANTDGTGNPWKLQIATQGPGDLRGFWLWFDPGVKQGQSYPSTGSDPKVGPVHFFVLRPLPDGGMSDTQASLVDGGTVLFTAAGPDYYAGTLSKLALVRNAQTLATVESGAFMAVR